MKLDDHSNEIKNEEKPPKWRIFSIGQMKSTETVNRTIYVFSGNLLFCFFTESSFSFEKLTRPTNSIRNNEYTIYQSEYTQPYLSPAPIGVDVVFGWALPGGTGNNVKIIDIEKRNF